MRWMLAALILAATVEPTTVLEYVQKNEVAFERVTLFEDGTLVLHRKGPGDREQLLKRNLSKEEIEVYKTALLSADWSRIPSKTSGSSPGPLVSLFELNLNLEGKTLQVSGSLLDTFPLELGNLLAVVEDFRQLMQKRTTDVHPLLKEPPETGDRLVDFLNRVFKVRRFREEDGVYVLEGVDVPLSFELTLEQLPAVFRGYADHGG